MKINSFFFILFQKENVLQQTTEQWVAQKIKKKSPLSQNPLIAQMHPKIIILTRVKFSYIKCMLFYL